MPKKKQNKAFDPDMLVLTKQEIVEFCDRVLEKWNKNPKANLPYSRLVKFVENLTGADLINKIEYDGKNTFVITPKGRQYLESYEKFANFVESFGLDR